MKRFGIAVAEGVLLCAMVALPSAAPAVAATGCALPVFGSGADYHPGVRPAEFSADVTNPWFPLRPGTTYVYAGVKDGRHAVDVFAVSRRTRIIDGVRTRMVEDRLLLDGRLEERTSDYYAQDRCGNVWYFGEDTAVVDGRGRVTDRSGSFRAGVAGAEPGVYIQRDPQLGRRFRQEWSPGNAADTYRAVSRSARVSSPYTGARSALRTEESTELEPGVLDNKLYVRGIGQVEEIAVAGPTEKLILVDILH